MQVPKYIASSNFMNTNHKNKNRIKQLTATK